MRMLTRTKENAKLAKATATDYEIVSLFLHPSVTMCPYASKYCLADCLNTSGRAAIFPMILEARKRKTKLFLENPSLFHSTVEKELRNTLKRAKKTGKKLAFRPNGTSDRGEFLRYASAFPEIQVYDYTKDFERVKAYASGQLPKNYHLTFSFSGSNESEAKQALALGVNVAVVFDSASFPSTFWGYPVTSGELTDLRFLDPKQHVIALKAKGKAKKHASPFIIQIDKVA